MKHTPKILLLTLVAASASAAQYGAGNGLNYNRLGVGYESDDALKSLVISGEAKLGDHVLVGGSYSDVDGKGLLDGTSGNIARFSLGAVFNAGPGDVILRASYGQGHLTDGVDIAVADERSFGVSYRAELGAGFEGEVGYSRVRTRIPFVLAGLQLFTSNDDVFAASVRYNITKNFDVKLAYSFQSKEVGGDKLGISAGYSF
jgi:hypothetical protein